MKLKSENISIIKSGANNMLFNSKHYVPILKWKRAEQGALKSLAEEYKQFITPVIQLVMPKYKPQDKLEDVVKKFWEQAPQIREMLIDVWGRDPIFVDVSLLFTTSLKVKSLNTILREGHKCDGFFIPVIHLNDDQEIKKTAYSLAKENKSGIC